MRMEGGRIPPLHLPGVMMAKVRYIGPKAKIAIQLPIGWKYVTKDVLVFGHGESRDLSDEDAQKLVQIGQGAFAVVSETDVAPIEAVTVSTPDLGTVEAPKRRRGRPPKRKVEG